MEKFVPKVSEMNEGLNPLKPRRDKGKGEKDKYFDRERLTKARLTQTENTLANRFMKIMQGMGNRPKFDQLKAQMLDVMNDPTVQMSKRTKSRWLPKIEAVRPGPRGLEILFGMLTNIPLKGDGLGVG